MAKLFPKNRRILRKFTSLKSHIYKRKNILLPLYVLLYIRLQDAYVCAYTYKNLRHILLPFSPPFSSIGLAIKKGHEFVLKCPQPARYPLLHFVLHPLAGWLDQRERGGGGGPPSLSRNRYLGINMGKPREESKKERQQGNFPNEIYCKLVFLPSFHPSDQQDLEILIPKCSNVFFSANEPCCCFYLSMRSPRTLELK